MKIEDFKDQQDVIGFYSFLETIKELSERTINLYLGWYKFLDIQRVTPDIDATQKYIQEFLTAKGNHPPIRYMVFNYLEYKGLKKQIDLPPKPSGRKPVKLARFITPQEIRAMIDYAYSKKFKNGLLVDLIYQGALRRSEIKTITLGDFNWNRWARNQEDFCELKIHGKGNKERIVLINPETMQNFLNFLKEKNTPYEFLEDTTKFLFLQRVDKSKTINECDIYNKIKDYAWKALNRDVRPHELRHARAKELEKRGINIKDIKNYLGHTNLTTTEIYLHTTTEESTKNIKENLSQDAAEIAQNSA